MMHKATRQEVVDVAIKVDTVLANDVFLRNAVMDLLDEGEKNRKLLLELNKQHGLGLNYPLTWF
jgi:hypothetical protein